MELRAAYDNGKLTVQPTIYIEDAWYLELENGLWHVFEIPEGGGEDRLIDSSPSFDVAFEIAINLT